ncbi:MULTISPECIES: serine hydrolase [Roseiflexus]|uniref:Beta-lactamase n=1 Tax=Roseiflexus castenholzii (strain DSM 13941 / HLO8) TaxID=383372 RepID=A7NHV6_ROSCS|nr:MULTISPECIES: serine hydrolase domain-containing protein [Roseiflexus]ABU57053.1 beta-lactamase [Roseiflexus castenholzii DSM 13941]GIV99872.1 MAG: serine hydrolase [Roseiflexus sp.]
MIPETHPVDNLLRPFDGHVPGISALLLVDGSAQYARALGKANLEQNTAISIATNFRLASVSKQFTAAAVLRLAERGALSLDEPIVRFFESAPAFWRQITVHHLLTHTSGLVDYEELIDPNTATQLHDCDVFALVRRVDTGYAAPGAAFRYSNTGYCLLALIVERVAAQPFAAFLREQVFLPAGMRFTVAYEGESSAIPRRAFGYSFRGGTFVRTDQNLTSATLGDGGIYSSTIDLERWDAALSNDTLLPEPWRAAMFTPHIAMPSGESYGYGWFLTSIAGRRAAYHTGETIGFRTAIVRLLDRRCTAVVLANRSEAAPLPLARTLIETALEKDMVSWE